MPTKKTEFDGELAFVKDLAREAADVALSRAKRVNPREKANLSFRGKRRRPRLDYSFESIAARANACRP